MEWNAMNNKISTVLEYLSNVLQANTEQAKKELLKDLLLRLFDDDPNARTIINKMSLGSEHAIFNIKLKNRTKTGFADTQYNNVIIEFENDLRKTGEHAIEQLSEYLVGNWNSGSDYNFTLISTDCVTWKVYSPDYVQLLGKPDLSISDIRLLETRSFTLTNDNASDFYYFLDHYLFKNIKSKATLENIQHDFGDTSATFLSCIRLMREHFNKVKNLGEIKVAYEEWNKFLSIAYGSFEGSEDVFLVHTYLSIFAKMLAYSVISHKEFLQEKEMSSILKGTAFRNYNIENFVEDDFYHWVSGEASIRPLKPVFRKISQQISQYDFKDVDEDVLKGVYQELIDLETRHSLGEYYTPDWLCEKITEQYEFKKDSFILDPACGSGSFLRAVIARLKHDFADIRADEIANQVNGIDIHPLSVQIAKTTLLVAIGKDLLAKAKRPVQLKVFLANTLFAPEGTIDLFGDEYSLIIDKGHYSVSTKVFENAKLFDLAISVCDDLADASKGAHAETKETLERALRKRYTNGGLTSDIVDSFHKIYLGLKDAKEHDRDSIWKFVLQNSYKPFFLRQKFDFVLGNPPWLTYADVANNDYQVRLRKLAEKYKLIPAKVSNFPHLEIAATFLAHSASYFLKKGACLAFVLPRAFFSADHHDNTRSGKVQGFRIEQIWDLKDVAPLFRVPACAIFVRQSLKPLNSLPSKGIGGFSISGRLKIANCSLDTAAAQLAFTPATWYYSRLQQLSAFTNKKIKQSSSLAYYDKFFKQGATIVPRNCYFVEITQDYKGGLADRYLQVKTSETSIAEAKMPWKNIHLSGSIHSSFLFYTALAKNIFPFGLISPPLVLLPIRIDEENRIKLCDWANLQEQGYLETAAWFKKTESLWKKDRTENNANISSIAYLNWQKKLTDQNLNAPFLVLYTASAKNANATIVRRTDHELSFIVESKTYVLYTNNLSEAEYLTCCLNSNFANDMVKDFQSRGLFGPRDIHKKILEIPFPKFDPKNPLHNELAGLGRACQKKADDFIKNDITPAKYNIGLLRTAFLKRIKIEMNKIDNILKKTVR
jgi:type I restriction-modification system DNA methylase subunit